MSGRTAANPARRRETGAGSETPWIVLGVAVLAVVAVLGSVLAAARLGGATLGDPGGYLVGLVTGGSSWPGWLATTALVAIWMAVAVLGIGAWRVLRRRDPRTVGRIDARAQSMATTKDLAVMLPAGAAADAARLNSTAAGIGVPIAEHVPSWRPPAGQLRVGAELDPRPASRQDQLRRHPADLRDKRAGGRHQQQT